MAQTQERHTDILAGIDWAVLSDEMLGVLQGYIRLDTSNPPGNENLAVDYLRPILEREGLAVQVAATAPNRSNLLATWAAEGTPTGKPIILLNHMDVVPVEREKWTVEPFAGVIKDGLLWGRGTLDMKGLALLQLFGLLALKRAGVKPRCTVYFLAVSDEEAGADYGAERVLEQFPELREAGCVYNEGSAGLDFGAGPFFGIQSAEKGVFQATLVAKGKPGHGSMVNKDNAAVLLIRALNRLSRATRPLDPQPESFAFTDALGHSMPGVAGHLLRRRTWPGVLRLASALDPLMASNFRDHVSLTMLEAGYKVNVIPSEARASIDMRLMPGQTEDKARAWLKRVMREPAISIETIQYSPGSRSSANDPAFTALRDAISAEYLEAKIAAYMSAGATDSRIFRKVGIPSYGLMPLVLSRAMIAGLHGHDERIPIAGMDKGLRIIARTLVGLGVVG